jgi:hypothetical protein
MSEYIVLSKEDIKKYLSILEKSQLEFIIRSIEISRELDKKKNIKYVVSVIDNNDDIS